MPRLVQFSVDVYIICIYNIYIYNIYIYIYIYIFTLGVLTKSKWRLRQN